MQRFKYNDQDLLNVIEGELDDPKDWNKFNTEHHMSECSVCNTEYVYCSGYSPVLNDTLWHQIQDYYGLKDPEYLDNNSINFSTILEKRLEMVRKIVTKIPSENHCTICVKCMEKALGRKIKVSDLVSCKINDRFLLKREEGEF